MKMIKNVGIDIIQNKRIKPSIELSNKLLSQQELAHYELLTDKIAQQQYLAGRWAVKEALIKALEVKVILNEVTIQAKENGKLIVKGIKLLENETIHVSLSHEWDYTVGMAVFSSDEKK